MKKIYTLISLSFIVFSANAQWDGTTDFTNPVWRSGSVGVGMTSAPLEKFQIGGIWTFHDGGDKIIGYNHDFTSSSIRIIDREAQAIRFTGDGKIKFQVAPYGTSGSPIAWTDALTVDNSGNVAIGLPWSDMKLDVNGDMRLRGDLSTIYFRRNTSPADIAKLSYDQSNTRFVIGANNKDIVFQSKLNFDESVRITHTGNVGIGTSAPNEKLTVNGTIYGKEVKVDLNVPGPDYVFEKDYNLPSLEEIKNYIDKHKHLPEVPSAKEMEANGINVGEMNMILLKKVEELTLHLIEQNKKIDAQQSEIEALKKQ